MLRSSADELESDSDSGSGPDTGAGAPGHETNEPWTDIPGEDFTPELRFPTDSSVRRWILAAEGPQRQLARRLVFALHVGVIPCPEEKHAKAERRHKDECVRHHGLEDTYHYRDPQHPASEAETAGTFGLYRETPNIPLVWASKTREAFPNCHRLAKVFSSDFGEGDQVCLHKGAPSRPELQISIKDVDSSMIIFHDLNRITEPLSLSIVPQPANLLKRSIHLTYEIRVDGRRTNVPIHKIPHTLLGVTGTRSHPVYAFFPRMFSPDKKASVNVSDAGHAAFFRHFIHPAFSTINTAARSSNLGNNGSEILQHLPATYEIALATSRAKAEQSGGGGGTRGRPINVTFTPSTDRYFWEAMAKRLKNPPPSDPDGFNLENFRGVFFLYNSKGTKVETHRQRSLATCIKDYRKAQEAYLPEVDASLYPGDRQYIDIASSTHALDDGNYKQGATLLAKKCCAINTLRVILDGVGAPDAPAQPAPPPSAAPGQPTGNPSAAPARHADPPPAPPKSKLLARVNVTEYPVNLLRDTASFTAEPTPTHPEKAHGLMYIQTYSPVKEVFDARGVYPFSHKGIVNLGYSDRDAAAMHAIQKTTGDRVQARDADRRSRGRIRLALGHASGPKHDFGWRFEVRVSLALAHIIQEEDTRWETFLTDLFRGTKRRARSTATSLAPADPAELRLNDITLPSRAFYVYNSEMYRSFLRGNIDKHLVAIDSIRALYGKDTAPSMAAAALHALLVLCLRHFIAPLPRKESWVLTNELGRPDSDQTPGLGMDKTRLAWGFAFLPSDVIDWRNLQVKTGFDKYKITIPGFHRSRRFRHTLAFQDARSFLDELLELVDGKATPPPSREACEFVMEKCVHLILQEYRDEAIRKLIDEKNARRLYPSPQSDGSLFSFERLAEVVDKIGFEVTRVSGNKAHFKKPVDLFYWLFTNYETPLRRDKIDKYPFRNFTELVYNALYDSSCEHVSADRFLNILAYRFFEQHTTVPYPKSCGALVQKQTKTYRRVLISFRPLDQAEAVPIRISFAEIADRVVADPFGRMRLPPPRPVPGCLDQIQTIEEVKEWLAREENLYRYR